MGARIDLTGRQFGYLTVISSGELKRVGRVLRTHWICQCQCGNITSVLASNLTKPKNGTKSCGCRRIEIGNNHKYDLTGQKFGDLVVCRFDSSHKAGNKKRRHWWCKCICGNELSVSRTNLTRGNTQSCGCLVKRSKKYNFIDLTNNIYGQLTVIKRLDEYTKTRGALWECLCQCGKIVKLPSNALTSGNNTTCGNKNKYHLIQYQNNMFSGIIPKTHFTSIKNGATGRNLTYDVSEDYLNIVFNQQNGICPITGLKLEFTQSDRPTRDRWQTTASLDRIDSNAGYIEGNVRWVHKDINKMRSNHTDAKFLRYCALSTINNIHKIDRPDWDMYFLLNAKLISLRSDDPNIKHGAIITTLNNRIIGTGYNGTIQGADINLIPLNNRDLKRNYMIHAEENSVLNCSENPNYIGGAKMYITGKPCINCLQRIINFGIQHVIYLDCVGTITENSTTEAIRTNILNMSKIHMTAVKLEDFLDCIKF